MAALKTARLVSSGTESVLSLLRILETVALETFARLAKHEIVQFKKISNKIIFLDMRSPNHEDSTITLDFDKAVTDALVYLKTLNHKYE